MEISNLDPYQIAVLALLGAIPLWFLLKNRKTRNPYLSGTLVVNLKEIEPLKAKLIGGKAVELQLLSQVNFKWKKCDFFTYLYDKNGIQIPDCIAVTTQLYDKVVKPVQNIIERIFQNESK